MGTVRMVEFDGKANDIIKAINASNKETLTRASMAVKSKVLSRATSATGGDLKFSGFGRKVGVRFFVGPYRSVIRAVGPMHWLESGVRRHSVAPKSLGGSRAARGAFIDSAFGSASTLTFGKKAGALKFETASGTTFAKYARKSGGLKPLHAWSKGIEDAQPEIAREFGATVMRAISTAFG